MCGGAGFLGSHIVRRFVRAGDAVVVIDGEMPGTGGTFRNLADLRNAIDLRLTPIEAVHDLRQLVGAADVIVDAMAWTRHVAALDDPLQDMRLNLASHLTLVQALHGQDRRRLVVYLGSRSQYGRMPPRVVTEDDPLRPQDPQGVHKTAAESHFRNYARLDGYDVVSLRLPNCFGEGQPVSGEDIGLIGGFIRALSQGEAVEVYGTARRRTVLYAGDAAEITSRVVRSGVGGFHVVNVAGEDVEIRQLAMQLCALVGRGRVVDAPMPPTVAALDPGEATVDDARLRALIGQPPRSDFPGALQRTIAYFQERLG